MLRLNQREHNSIDKNHNRVCIIRSNPVNPDSRVEKEAETLKSAGYDVHILAWDRDGNHKSETSYILNNIPITRIGYKSGYGEGLKNLKSRIGFQVGMVMWILRHGQRLDAVHACDVDTGLFSFFPSRLMKCKFIYDVFDFICAEPKDPFQWMVKKVQEWLINHADATIICSEQRKKQIKNARPKKLIIIHNTPDETMKKVDSPIVVDHSRISVVYVGMLLRDRLLEEIISYFIKNQDKDFYIGGFGQLEDEIRCASDRYNNIHFVGRISYEQTIALEHQCDLMVAAYNLSIENHRMAAPNKFYESLMLGKPIIMVKGMGIYAEVEKHRIGALIEYSEDSFGAGIKELVERREEWNRIGQRAKKLYADKYSWSIMRERLVNLYKELI